MEAQFPLSGCGNDTTINVFFSAQDNKNLRNFIAEPGAPHAGILLQRDALGYV